MDYRKEFYKVGIDSLIEDMRLDIINNDTRYEDLLDTKEDIFDDNPDIEKLICSSEEINLNNIDVETLRTYLSVEEEMKEIEEIEIFLLGAKEMYRILKVLKLLK